MIDYSKLQKSLKHLELQFQNYQLARDRPELTEIDREAIAESVIQRFEVGYDTLLKVVKRYLIEDLGLADVPSSPKPILKLVGQSDLFSTPVEQWLKYADARTATAHDYSGEKAAETLLLIKDFIADASALFEKITGTAWK